MDVIIDIINVVCVNIINVNSNIHHIFMALSPQICTTEMRERTLKKKKIFLLDYGEDCKLKVIVTNFSFRMKLKCINPHSVEEGGRSCGRSS